MGTYQKHLWYHWLFFHMIDITIVEAWLLYKKDSSVCSVLKMEQLSLLDFTADVANCLCNQEKIFSKRRRPSLSVEASLDMKYKLSCTSTTGPCLSRQHRPLDSLQWEQREGQNSLDARVSARSSAWSVKIFLVSPLRINYLFCFLLPHPVKLRWCCTEWQISCYSFTFAARSAVFFFCSVLNGPI